MTEVKVLQVRSGTTPVIAMGSERVFPLVVARSLTSDKTFYHTKLVPSVRLFFFLGGGGG